MGILDLRDKKKKSLHMYFKWAFFTSWGHVLSLKNFRRIPVIRYTVLSYLFLVLYEKILIHSTYDILYDFFFIWS